MTTSPRFQPTLMASARATEVIVNRQPVVDLERTVHGYAVNVVVRAPLSNAHFSDELDAMVHARYADLDLTSLAYQSLAFVRATTAMLTGAFPLPVTLCGVVLEVPRHFADEPGAAAHLTRLRAPGVGLALADYVPGGSQDDLLPLVDYAKVDLRRGHDAAALAIDRAHQSNTQVIAERVASEAAVRFCTASGVDMLQGPLFQRDTPTVPAAFTAGQIQCLELMQLLSVNQVDLNRVIRVIGADPELAMRVLGLVNASSIGARRRIDSVRQAVIMLGPRPLGAVAAASLINARSHSIAGLWFVLTRAIACRSIAGSDAGYTVGLLAAVASQLQVDPAELIARAGVSDDVGDAILTLYGPYGPVLAAVLAHEENDFAGVEATGLAPYEVANSYVAAIGAALKTTTSLFG